MSICDLEPPRQVLSLENGIPALKTFMEQSEQPPPYQPHSSQPLAEVALPKRIARPRGVPVTQFRVKINEGSIVQSLPSCFTYSDSELREESELAIPSFGYFSTQHNWLLFNASFEGSNLYSVQKINSHFYQIHIRSDFNAENCKQWFYFKASSSINNEATFQVTGFKKRGCAFKLGMRPAVWSSLTKQWSRGGQNLSFGKNPEGSYSVSFSYKFSKHEDVYFAYSMPYSVRDFYRFLHELRGYSLRRRVLCYSRMSNPVELLHFGKTHPDAKHVFILGRVHSGAPVTSIVSQGIVRELAEQFSKNQSESLNFWVLPMVNVDGALLGNYRCNFAGKDLNHTWKNPNSVKSAESYFIRELILRKGPNVAAVVLLEGNSSSRGIKAYGVHRPSQPVRCRLFPKLLEYYSPLFSFDDSIFSPHSKCSKQRQAFSQDMGVKFVYSLEISCCGPKQQPRHFGSDELVQFGRAVIKSLAEVFQTVEKDSQHSSKLLSSESRAQDQQISIQLREVAVLHRLNLELCLSQDNLAADEFAPSSSEDDMSQHDSDRSFSLNRRPVRKLQSAHQRARKNGVAQNSLSVNKLKQAPLPKPDDTKLHLRSLKDLDIKKSVSKYEYKAMPKLGQKKVLKKKLVRAKPKEK